MEEVFFRFAAQTVSIQRLGRSHPNHMEIACNRRNLCETIRDEGEN
jgi:hypothetical protein